jgi:hypothetical protein
VIAGITGWHFAPDQAGIGVSAAPAFGGIVQHSRSMCPGSPVLAGRHQAPAIGARMVGAGGVERKIMESCRVWKSMAGGAGGAMIKKRIPHVDPSPGASGRIKGESS